jgi:hypothetical protein
MTKEQFNKESEMISTAVQLLIDARPGYFTTSRVIWDTLEKTWIVQINIKGYPSRILQYIEKDVVKLKANMFADMLQLV